VTTAPQAPKWVKPSSQQTKRFLAVVLAILVCDIITKQVMLALIFSPPRIIEVLPILNWAPVWNKGISFGLFSGYPQIVRFGISALAILVALWLYVQLAALTKGQQIAAALISGGAIGNVIDRIIYGKVIDFVDFHLGSWHYPAFNVADSAIFIGVLLWIITVLRHGLSHASD